MGLIIFLSLVGIAFVYLEFFIPGSLLAILGGMSLLASWSLFAFKVENSFYALIYLLALALVVGLVIKCAISSIKKTGKRGSFFLLKDQTGYVASAYQKDVVGKAGVALSDLRPSGYISVDQQDYQAMTKMGYVDKGSRIKVIGGEGAHLIVEKIETGDHS